MEHARRIGDELLVLEDVYPLEVVAVRLEERVTAEPVLEQAVVAASATPPRGRERDWYRVPHDHDE